MKQGVKIILTCSICAIVLYFIIWRLFILEGNIPIGVNLTKADWLNFLSGFLGFLGTTFLGVITLTQTHEINNQRILSDYRVQLYPSIHDPVLIVYDDSERDLDNCLDYRSTNYLREKDTKEGKIIIIQFPSNISSNRIPDSIYIESAEIYVYNYGSSCVFENLNIEFGSVLAEENNKFKINLKLGVNVIRHELYDDMIKSKNQISLYLEMLIKIENVITPVTYSLNFERLDGEDRIKSGYIQHKKSYIAK